MTRILYTLGNLCMTVGFQKYFYDYDLFFLLKYYSCLGDQDVLIKVFSLILF